MVNKHLSSGCGTSEQHVEYRRNEISYTSYYSILFGKDHISSTLTLIHTYIFTYGGLTFVSSQIL